MNILGSSKSEKLVSNSQSYTVHCFMLFVMLFILLLPQESVAAGKRIAINYISPKNENTQSIRGHLSSAINRKNSGEDQYIWEELSQNRSCKDKNKCLAIEIVEDQPQIIITFYAGDGQKIQYSQIKVENDASMFDVAQMLAMKILLIVKQLDEKAKRAANSEQVDETEAVEGVKAETEGNPQKNQTENQTKAPDPSTETEPEKALEPEPEKEKKTTDDNTGSVIQPFNNRWEYEYKNQKPGRDTAIVHLQIKPVFITGFEYEYNTGGLELGITWRLFKPLALKLDIGCYPNGRTHKYVQTYSNWSLLPVELSVGYRNSFNNWYVAGYGGIYTMQVWSSHRDEDEDFSDSKFMYGFSLTAEGGYNFHKWLSIGMFIRPFYLINNYEVTMSYIYTEPSDSTDSTDSLSRVIEYTGFKLPKFQMMIGFVININF